MAEYRLAEAEARFADIIWDREPILSKELIKLSEEQLAWKSTTSYTVLRRLCDRGIFQNIDSTVTSKISRKEFYSFKSQQFVEDTFGGSLPKFLTAFIGGKKLNEKQITEIKELIEQFEEGEDE